MADVKDAVSYFQSIVDTCTIAGGVAKDFVTNKGVQAVGVPLVGAVACAIFAKYAHQKAGASSRGSETAKAWKLVSFVAGTAAVGLTFYAAIEGHKASQYTIAGKSWEEAHCTEHEDFFLCPDSGDLMRKVSFSKCTDREIKTLSNLFGYSKELTSIIGAEVEGQAVLPNARSSFKKKNDEYWGSWFVRLCGGTTSMDEALADAKRTAKPAALVEFVFGGEIDGRRTLIRKKFA